ncbi:MAG TPA: sulfatase-like hydrolase/transferase [Candidatus Binatia bacterium]|nr:sulfatase-like hydrolase/transferase [Candidatus Binatia bacterium]
MLPARGRGGQSGITPLALHPLLAAAYPVGFLFAQNVAEQVTLQPLWLPLVASVAGGAAALVAGRLVTGDWLRGALLATLGLALFFSFGHVWNLVGETLVVRRWLIGAYALVGIVGAVIAWRGGPWVPSLSRFLALALLIGIALNAWSIASFGLRGPAAPVAGPIDVTVGERGRPDIYFVVVDRYAGEGTLREQYEHDNDPFLDALRQRGFTIATDAWANYLKTALSLASTLSMDHLDGDALSAAAEPGRELVVAYDLLQGRLAVPATLQALGYEWVHIGSYWEPTGTNRHADRVIGSSRGDQFSAALLSTTVLSLLSPPVDPGERTIEGWGTSKEFTIRQFEHLAASADLAGPSFVFTHFLVPHPPYNFDVDGSTPTEEERAARSEEEEYVRQLLWTNDRLLETIDALLDVPAGEEPIIVLAADEGPFPPGTDTAGFDWLEATPAQVERKYAILNALRLPGVVPSEAGVHDRSSPVNTFRYVMNAYFGADLPLLPDSVLLSPDYRRLYDFVEVERADDGAPILPAARNGP